MKQALYLLLSFALLGCGEAPSEDVVHKVDWSARKASIPQGDSLISGQSYLSVYSQIYSQSAHKMHNLTATVSMRNTHSSDTIYLNSARYYDTHGKAIRTYFDEPIFICPMETVEIVIYELDKEGGTGANFLIDWTIPATAHEPLFEAVMISTSAQQGLSFSTSGKRIR